MSEEQLRILFGDVTVVQAVLVAGTVIAVIALLIKAWPKIRRLFATLDSLAVLPERMQLLEEIHQEVRPNHGSSMNDSLSRVEVESARQGKRLDRQAEQLNRQDQQTVMLQRQLGELQEQLAGLQDLMEAGDRDLSGRVTDIEETLNPKKE